MKLGESQSLLGCVFHALTKMPAFIPTIPSAFFGPCTSSFTSIQRFPINVKSFPARRHRCLSPMASATAPPLDEGMVLFAKAGPDGKSMGDCPFTMKANLALRFKEAEFKIHFINASDKPGWFLDLNEDGTTPVFVDGTHAIGESDEIVDYADEIGPKKSLILSREDDPRWDAAFDAVSPVFGALVRLIKNKKEAKEASFKNDLADALKKLDAFLGEGEGPFLLGADICALDCNLAPKLQHVMVAAVHYKGFEVPEECAKVREYMENMRGTDEWKVCSCPDDAIIWGWSKFFT